MKAVWQIEKPGEIEATIAFTFTLEQWQTVHNGLTGSPYYGPTGEVKEAISELLKRACDKIQYAPTPTDTGGR